MLKVVIVMGLFFTLVNCASYKPVIDTAGKSGTFNEDKAKEISNDLQHCKMMAEENITTLSNIGYWLFSPTMDTKYEAYYRKCMFNRGHSILN